MDILKRSMAPITDAAWSIIEGQAKSILSGNLSGRKLVDFQGPKGLDFAAVNLGTLRIGNADAAKGVTWGVREVQPLVEVRISFALDIWDLDNVSRGSLTPDVSAVDAAARKMAAFEETAVYKGFEAGGIKGILPASPNKAVPLPKEAAQLPEAVESAILAVERHGIGGPYALVLGTKTYQMLMVGDEKGYPLRKRIDDMVRGGIHWSPVVEGGVLISRRGGDYMFTSGLDLSIGYHSHTTKKVELFLTESFTFQVIEPAAAVGLQAK
jgi:uncharacterized linocin/CFP29 family protein